MRFFIYAVLLVGFMWASHLPALAQFPDAMRAGGGFPDATNSIARTRAAQQMYWMNMQRMQEQRYAQDKDTYGSDRDRRSRDDSSGGFLYDSQGRSYMKTGSGDLIRSDGRQLQRFGNGGWIDTKTGRFIPRR